MKRHICAHKAKNEDYYHRLYSEYNLRLQYHMHDQVRFTCPMLICERRKGNNLRMRHHVLRFCMKSDVGKVRLLQNSPQRQPNKTSLGEKELDVILDDLEATQG